MPGDDVPLHRAQGKFPPGIGQCPLGMGEAVEAVAGVTHMPVVEEEVMEQGAPDQGPAVHPQSQNQYQIQSQTGHSEGVVKYADRAVLAKQLLALYPEAGKHIRAVEPHQCLYAGAGKGAHSG